MTDAEFLQLIKENSEIGYGRMMQIISYAWFKELERAYGREVANGAFAGTCIAFLNPEQQEEYFGILQQELANGMDY